MRKLKKYKVDKNLHNSDMTNEMRDYVKKYLGKLDTAKSFMYLYLRFGEPNVTNKDEYKLLYDYLLKCGDLYVSIHASYYEHVYFNFRFDKKYTESWFENNELKKEQIIISKIRSGIPYLQLNNKYDYLSDDLKKENNTLLTKFAHEIYSAEQYDILLNQFNNETDDYSLVFDFEEQVTKVFWKNLSKNEESIMSKYAPSITDIPAVKDMLDRLIFELKKGYYVRDVRLNILDYESSINTVINKHKKYKSK